jgi:hypothetical protein
MSEPVLLIHKAGHDYIGQLTVAENMITSLEAVTPPQRVIIMDNSGSMGQWSKRCLQHVFPQALSQLGAQCYENLLVILFSSKATHHPMKVQDLPHFDPGRQGTTQMAGVFSELQTMLDPGNPRVQLLVLSDGDVHDQQASADAAARVAPVLKGRHQIEARAIRLFTSQRGQPDTRALASVLQMNTDTVATLVDLPNTMPFDQMAQRIAQMFDGCSSHGCILRTENRVLLPQPWDSATHELNLRVGKNTFWIQELPEQPTLNDKPLEVQFCAPLNQGTMNEILEDRLEFFVSQLKVLKVIDTESAKEQIDRIVEYFKNLEASLQPAEELSPLLEGGGLKDRAAYFRKSLQSRVRSVTTLMESIANDDKVRALNQAQQADYLRQMDVSKNARALAKRAQTSGLDFDRTLRQEILLMKAHLDELKTIDVSGHSVSFYSQASTVDGIMQVCEMADDSDVFERLTALDLLRLFNIVGVPAVGPVADFPDPMTYRLDCLMAGNFISVADLSMVELAGSKLEAPGTGITIVNAIPVFEDLRVQRFLQRYAPSALEYVCSIGMRRVLAEVPLTFPYTICGGVWRLIQQLDMDKSELNIMLLQRMMPSYHASVKGRFDYLIPSLQADQDPDKSFFLSHNGITNMISPLWHLVEDGQLQNMPRILRALYTFETFQVMRRLCRQQDAKFYVEQLDRLLGVDFDAKGTPMPPMLHRPGPTYTQKVDLNREFFNELCQSLSHIKYATIFVQLFQGIRSSSPVMHVREIPQISDEFIAKALDLEYPLEEFLVYNIVEGLLYQSKQSRVDKDTPKSLRPDLGLRREGQKMCEEYILQRYSEDYDYRLKQMAGEEKKVLCDELIERLLETDSMDTFNSLLSEGVSHGEIEFKIVNVNSHGCLDLHDALMDTSRSVMKRSLKLEVFYTGEDVHQKPVWNSGNVYRAATAPLQHLLTSLGSESIWNSIQETYSRKISHVYRDGMCRCNRHGHSNDLPSFFAFGYDCLTSFVGSVCPEVWSEYRSKHQNCCGVAKVIGDGTHSSIERLAAKRDKRAECSSSQEKLNAAIDAKKAKRAMNLMARAKKQRC